jgi:hypothetical protein
MIITEKRSGVRTLKKRNISATIVVDVKRFSHQINMDEVFDTHRSNSNMNVLPSAGLRRYGARA